MNFFAHAMIAHRRRDDPRFVLGAMLPDLASMASLRIPATRDPELAAGIALHHETDRSFHGCEPFRALCESALTQLEAAGVSRGAARAVGHVGSELLLDGILSYERATRAAYARALDAGLSDSLAADLGFPGGPGPERLRELLAWLADGPLPEGYRDVDFVGERLTRILARRPRLALRPADQPIVRQWLRWAAPQVERDASAMLSAGTPSP